MPSLVGSEMCIRDRDKEAKWPSNINAPDCIDDIENDIVDISD